MAIACTESNLITELDEITNPYIFGLHLGIDSKVVARIDKDHRNDVEQQRCEVIKYWYQNTKESERTWGRVADAIKKLGGHRNLEMKLRQLATTGPLTGDSNEVPKDEAPVAVTNQTAPVSNTTPAFSDDLSPRDLVAWLSQELIIRGLSLDDKLKDNLIEEEINGAAFKNLSNEDLKEMGFKRGPRMNIMPIIEALKGKGNKRRKLADPEERVQHDDKDEIDATSIPRALCTMDFALKITESMSASGDSTAGFAPAALPYKSRLWRKKVLKIQLKNRHFIHGWNITLSKFMECANRWSDGMVSKGSNHIPRFESDDENPDIIVELNKNGENKSTIGYVKDEGPTKVYLDLSFPDKTYQEHLIVHEFGHVLGLGHEHQRSDFWSWIKEYIDEDKMKQDLGGRFPDWQRRDDQMDGGATPYDSDSAMHYWCKKRWLTKGYSDKKFLDQQSKYLSEGLKATLYGVHKRDGNVVTYPSVVDLDFLSAKYKEILPAKQSAEPKSTKKEAERTVADCEEPNNVNGTAHGPSPQSDLDFSGLKEVTSILLDLIRWDKDKNELRIYSKTAAHWRTIARKLGLEVETPGYIQNIAMRNFNDNNECVREVFGKWLENAIGLPNAERYPKSWEGLLNLLVDSDIGEVATTLRTALTAADSSVRRK